MRRTGTAVVVAAVALSLAAGCAPLDRMTLDPECVYQLDIGERSVFERTRPHPLPDYTARIVFNNEEVRITAINGIPVDYVNTAIEIRPEQLWSLTITYRRDELFDRGGERTSWEVPLRLSCGEDYLIQYSKPSRGTFHQEPSPVGDGWVSSGSGPSPARVTIVRASDGVVIAQR